MAAPIVAGGYRLDEATRLSLLPPPPSFSQKLADGELTGLEAAQIGHPEICAGTPRRAARRILDRDVAELFATGDLGRVL